MVLRIYSENILQICYVRLVVIHSDVIFFGYNNVVRKFQWYDVIMILFILLTHTPDQENVEMKAVLFNEAYRPHIRKIFIWSSCFKSMMKFDSACM